jgi:nicotinamidase-related amidase
MVRVPKRKLSVSQCDMPWHDDELAIAQPIAAVLTFKVRQDEITAMATGKTALLLIDIQQAMFRPEEICHAPEALIGRAADMLARARGAGVPVYHVQHCEETGPFKPGGTHWQIHPAVAPHPGEPVTEKWAASAFYRTELDVRLRAQGIERLVIAGLQSEFCIDTACRVAQSLGYEVMLAADAHSTFDSPELSASQIIAHHNRVLSGIVGWVVPANEIQL